MINMELKTKFIDLTKFYIGSSSTNMPQLNFGISIAQKLYCYLIEENKTAKMPIQEIIMGMGKSSIITPYICALLIIYLIQNKNDLN